MSGRIRRALLWGRFLGADLRLHDPGGRGLGNRRVGRGRQRRRLPGEFVETLSRYDASLRGGRRRGSFRCRLRSRGLRLPGQLDDFGIRGRRLLRCSGRLFRGSSGRRVLRRRRGSCSGLGLSDSRFRLNSSGFRLRSALGRVAAHEAAIFFAQARCKCSRVLLTHDSQHAFGVRFAREEAEPQAVTRAAVLDARHLIETIVLEPRDVIAVESHRCDRRAQVDDEQRRAGAACGPNGRERRRHG